MDHGIFDGEIEAVKSILYYKNYLPRSPAPYPWPIRPLVAALDAIDTLGDCAAAPTRLTPKSPPWYTSAGVRPLPIISAAATPSALGLFFPKRSCTCQRKKCANLLVSIWWCQPGYFRTS